MGGETALMSDVANEESDAAKFLQRFAYEQNYGSRFPRRIFEFARARNTPPLQSALALPAALILLSLFEHFLRAVTVNLNN